MNAPSGDPTLIGCVPAKIPEKQTSKTLTPFLRNIGGCSMVYRKRSYIGPQPSHSQMHPCYAFSLDQTLHLQVCINFSIVPWLLAVPLTVSRYTAAPRYRFQKHEPDSRNRYSHSRLDVQNSAHFNYREHVSLGCKGHWSL